MLGRILEERRRGIAAGQSAAAAGIVTQGSLAAHMPEVPLVAQGAGPAAARTVGGPKA